MRTFNLLLVLLSLFFCLNAQPIALTPGVAWSGSLPESENTTQQQFIYSIEGGYKYTLVVSFTEFASIRTQETPVTVGPDTFATGIYANNKEGLELTLGIATPCFTGSVNQIINVQCSTVREATSNGSCTFSSLKLVTERIVYPLPFYGAYSGQNGDTVYIAFTASSDKPIIATYDVYARANTVSMTDCGDAKADLSSFCVNPAFDFKTSHLVTRYVDISDPSSRGDRAKFYGQVLVGSAVSGKTYIFKIERYFGNALLNVSIVQEDYACDQGCWGKGACIQGTCVCDTSGNNVSPNCATTGFPSLVAGSQVSTSFSATSPAIYTFQINNTANLLYSLQARVQPTLPNYNTALQVGKDCVTQISSSFCYQQVTGGRVLDKNFCSSDAGSWSVLAYQVDGQANFSLVATALNYNVITEGNNYVSAGTYRFTTNKFMNNPTFTLISSKDTTKSMTVSQFCVIPDNAVPVVSYTRSLQIQQNKCVPPNTEFTITVNSDDAERYQLIVGEAAICADSCNFHGACLPNNTCICDEGYEGNLCGQVKSTTVVPSVTPVSVSTSASVQLNFGNDNAVVYSVNTPAGSFIKLAFVGVVSDQPIRVNSQLGSIPGPNTNIAQFASDQFTFDGQIALEDSVTYFVITDLTSTKPLMSLNFTVQSAMMTVGSYVSTMPANLVTYRWLSLTNCSTGFYLSLSISRANKPVVMTSSLFNASGQYGYAETRFYAAKACPTRVLVKITATSLIGFSDVLATALTLTLSNLNCPNGCSGNGDCLYNGVCMCRDQWSGAACDQLSNCVPATGLSFCTASGSVSAAPNPAGGCPGSVQYYDKIVLPQKFAELSPYFSGNCKNLLKAALCNMYLRPCTNTTLSVPCQSGCNEFFTSCPINSSLLASPLSRCGTPDFAFISNQCVNGTQQANTSTSYVCYPLTSVPSTTATASTTAISSTTGTGPSTTTGPSPTSSPTVSPTAAPTVAPTIPPGSTVSEKIVVQATVTLKMNGDPEKINKTLFAEAYALKLGIDINSVEVNITIIFEEKRAQAFNLNLIGKKEVDKKDVAAVAQLEQITNTASLQASIQAELSNPNSTFSAAVTNSGASVSSVSAAAEVTTVTTISTPAPGTTSTTSRDNSPASNNTVSVIFVLFASVFVTVLAHCVIL